MRMDSDRKPPEIDLDRREWRIKRAPLVRGRPIFQPGGVIVIVTILVIAGVGGWLRHHGYTIHQLIGW